MQKNKTYKKYKKTAIAVKHFMVKQWFRFQLCSYVEYCWGACDLQYPSLSPSFILCWVTYYLFRRNIISMLQYINIWRLLFSTSLEKSWNKKRCVNVMPDINIYSSSRLHCLFRPRNQTGLVVLLQMGEKTPQGEVGKVRRRTARN